MSERYKPSKLKRERAALGELPKFEPKPREQTVWRNGKPMILSILLCRAHDQPWQTCSICSKPKR